MSVGEKNDIYTKLALLWTGAMWGWADYLPESGVLQEILKENFSEEEAGILRDIPLKSIPLEIVTLEEIVANSSFPREKLEPVLDSIAERGLLYKRTTENGEKGYSLLRQGYGFSQIFFWTGNEDAHTRKMAQLDIDPEYTRAKVEMYTPLDTKVFRYIPVTSAIDPNWQNVYPSETIEKVIKDASRIALANCPCRVKYELNNGKSCGHSKDVCIKLNELAGCLIEAGIAREITKEEALEVIKKADDEGLVHFTDNTGKGIKHICNCCGCACWNVSPIRRRLVPRDMLMATYFLRETVEDECTACENCLDICPVDAVKIEDGVAKVDMDWCIGCGVCVPRCDNDAIRLVEKQEKPAQTIDFVDLHTRISSERALIKSKKEQN